MPNLTKCPCWAVYTYVPVERYIKGFGMDIDLEKVLIAEYFCGEQEAINEVARLEKENPTNGPYWWEAGHTWM